jgi:hypothetical protein
MPAVAWLLVGSPLFFYWLNTHAPLGRSNATCFIVHVCYNSDIGDAVTRSVSGFPVHVSLLHRYILGPLKVTTSAIVIIDQSLSILRTVNMILGASRLFLVYLPANSRTLTHYNWIFIFADLVSHTDIVNGITFDLRYHKGSPLFLEFWSGGDRPWFFSWPVTIAMRIGVTSIFSFCLSCTFGKNSFVIRAFVHSSQSFFQFSFVSYSILLISVHMGGCWRGS